ncbi:QcrA and Rieske domain-containing protein [Desulfogranum japonicum]|uniref:QcrA and Rieske domain-containing protein n=1 Tax=Desulfogranum japonicum TaxID=231447 RepID=UPI001969C0FF|nr:Rieske 2Fe-2S domain-containing protein [Desulfogranum japonicum]
MTTLWSLGLFAVISQSLWMVIHFFQSDRSGANGGAVIDLGTIADIPAVGEPPKLYREGKFWLVHTDQGINAYHTACTHLHCLFNWNSEAEQFVCPCHGSRFGKDGIVLQGPARRDLDRYCVRIVNAEGRMVKETDAQGQALSIPVQELTETANDASGSLLMVQVDTQRKISGINRH